MRRNLDMAAELARLRGDMTTAFEQMKGQLNLLVQGQGHVTAELDELDKRVTALEARRVPLPVLAAVSGTVSAVVAIGAFLVQI